MIRTTFLGSSMGATARLMERSAAASKASARLSSGKAFSRPSEDPAAAATALGLRGEQSALKAYQAAAEDAKTRLDVADAQLNDVSALVVRLKELAVGAASGTTNAEGRVAIAAEAAQIRDHLVGLANARHLDQPLFAGFAPGDAVAKVAGVWTYSGAASEHMDRAISDSDSVQVNVHASEVFRVGASDAFTMLDTFIDDLNAGNLAGVSAAVDHIDELRASVSTARARIGAATNRVENVLEANRGRQTLIQAELSKVEDIDLVEGITEMNRMQAAYEAALGATANSLKQSLVDFLS
jgi:flagellar hook-associated protein 3 FlgL